jgi:glyoxylase-like metal-dependent hydrolase (beta-lactamase superfamily II)
MSDLDLEEVAKDVFRLPLAIPFEVGPVNCYLVRRDEPALIDCGPKTPEAWSALVAHLAALGVAPRDLRHLVATHSHIDHHGNLGPLAAAAPDAWVHIHEEDAPLVLEFEESVTARTEVVSELARTWGFPEEAQPLVRKMYRSFKKYAESLPRTRFRAITGEEAALDLGAVRLRALHMPGHTEGLVVLLLEEEGGILFSNDHVLERITPNPTAYVPPRRGRRTGLADYVASLGRLRRVEAARVLPGHGRPFGGLARRIDEILEHHERRKERVIELLGAEPAAPAGHSVLELALRLWPAIPATEYYLACREMLGHLEMLLEDGRAREAADGPVARFAKA